MNHFVELPNTAVLTLKGITTGKVPILYVVHNHDGWQFLSGDDVKAHEALVVGLQRVIDADETLLELGDLPEGWCAWRSSPSERWQRAIME